MSEQEGATAPKSTEKPTSGPWEAKQVQKDATALVPPGKGWGVIAVQPMRGRIDSSIEGMSEANARLIAAAPDLLKAAKIAADFYDAVTQSRGQIKDIPPSWMREQLHDAIAKAEGRTR